MSKYYYDLHIHSCLSPCADNDMTPFNICGMAALKGLQIVALTDHNSCANCEVFLKAAKKYGLIGICGMELTTAEEIHLVILFESLEQSLCFSSEVEKHRLMIPNKPEIFGDQLITDCEDETVATDFYFLPAATDLSLEQVYLLAKKFDAVIFPAHIDRVSNGIVGILGTVPEKPFFNCIEYNDSSNIEKYQAEIPSIKDKKVLVNSDAHHLWEINEMENFFELDDQPYSSSYVRQQLFKILKANYSEDVR